MLMRGENFNKFSRVYYSESIECKNTACLAWKEILLSGNDDRYHLYFGIKISVLVFREFQKLTVVAVVVVERNVLPWSKLFCASEGRMLKQIILIKILDINRMKFINWTITRFKYTLPQANIEWEMCSFVQIFGTFIRVAWIKFSVTKMEAFDWINYANLKAFVDIFVTLSGVGAWCFR